MLAAEKLKLSIRGQTEDALWEVQRLMGNGKRKMREGPREGWKGGKA